MSSRKLEPARNGLPETKPAAELTGTPKAPVALDLSEIAQVAHTLWLASGRAHGRDVENWYAAIEIVRARASR